MINRLKTGGIRQAVDNALEELGNLASTVKAKAEEHQIRDRVGRVAKTGGDRLSGLVGRIRDELSGAFDKGAPDASTLNRTLERVGAWTESLETELNGLTQKGREEIISVVEAARARIQAARDLATSDKQTAAKIAKTAKVDTEKLDRWLEVLDGLLSRVGRSADADGAPWHVDLGKLGDKLRTLRDSRAFGAGLDWWKQGLGWSKAVATDVARAAQGLARLPDLAEAGDKEGLINLFTRQTPAAAKLYDSRASAFRFGWVGSVGVGLMKQNGHQMTYVRPEGNRPGKIIVSALTGKEVRPAVNAGGSVLFGSVYGDAYQAPDMTGATLKGAEVGALMAASQVQSIQSGDGRTATGLTHACFINQPFNVPVISNFAASRLQERELYRFDLSPGQVNRIELFLSGAMDMAPIRGAMEKVGLSVPTARMATAAEAADEGAPGTDRLSGLQALDDVRSELAQLHQQAQAAGQRVDPDVLQDVEARGRKLCEALDIDYGEFLRMAFPSVYELPTDLVPAEKTQFDADDWRLGAVLDACRKNHAEWLGMEETSPRTSALAAPKWMGSETRADLVKFFEEGDLAMPPALARSLAITLLGGDVLLFSTYGLDGEPYQLGDRVTLELPSASEPLRLVSGFVADVRPPDETGGRRLQVLVHDGDHFRLYEPGGRAHDGRMVRMHAIEARCTDVSGDLARPVSTGR